MGELKVYNGASWDVARGKVWDGAAWVDQMSFYDGAKQVRLYPHGPGTAFLNTSSLGRIQDAIAFSGIQLSTDGNVYELDVDGTPVIAAATGWLGAGELDGFWVRCVLNSGGPFYQSDTITSWLPLTEDRIWQVRDATDNATAVVANITLSIATDDAGANVVASETYELQADWMV